MTPRRESARLAYGADQSRRRQQPDSRHRLQPGRGIHLTRQPLLRVLGVFDSAVRVPNLIRRRPQRRLEASSRRYPRARPGIPSSPPVVYWRLRLLRRPVLWSVSAATRREPAAYHCYRRRTPLNDQKNAPPTAAIPSAAALRQTKRRMWVLDVALLATGSVTIIFVFVVLTLSISWQYRTYATGIALVRNQVLFDVGAMLAFARAQDFAIVKTSSLFLGFVLIFIGCLYVLRIHEASFGLNLETPALGKATLQSSSPGLVLSALGVFLVISVLLFGRTWMQYSSGDTASGSSPNAPGASAPASP